MAKKEVSNEQLADQIQDLTKLFVKKFDESTKHTDKKFTESIKHTDDKFAESIKHTSKKFDESIKHSDNNTEMLARIVNNSFIKMSAENNRRFNLLETGQEDIKLRLDSTAYRFELVELQRRVKILETKQGIKN